MGQDMDGSYCKLSLFVERKNLKKVLDYNLTRKKNHDQRDDEVLWFLEGFWIIRQFDHVTSSEDVK